VTWSGWLKDTAKGLVIVLALGVAVLAVVGLISGLRQSSCNRLDAARVVHLEPGHDSPGPGSTFVRGVGPGPPPSELEAYLEAEAEMLRAGCAVPHPVLPSEDGS
jgi:hypothetical protein